ncbi:MAG: helix-turn-helix transcriptional regulator [Bacteroidetes bacterium]|nr:helix-turn-helix transcriptional regulator [Bacteroidota bacterium]
MENRFGSRIRILRELQKLYLRQVASLLDMDTAQLSKIEKGIRQIKKEQIPMIAKIYHADKNELLTLWLADQIINVTKGEEVALKAIRLAQNEIEIRNKKH